MPAEELLIDLKVVLEQVCREMGIPYSDELWRHFALWKLSRDDTRWRKMMREYLTRQRNRGR